MLPISLQQQAFRYKLEKAKQLSALQLGAIWQPLPGPQEDAYNSTADVIGYGGAAGGGKTDLALGFAFTKHQRSIIFRRLFTDLTALVERGDEIQDGRCTFVHSPKRRWDTPDGRFVEIGAVEHDKDKRKYRGNPHDFIAIDEAAEFSETVFRFVAGWLRTTDTGQATRVLLTFNPPTDATGEWIINYFAPWLDRQHVHPAQPGELRWYVRLEDQDVEVADDTPVTHDGAVYKPQSRTFFPARVEDNPFLMATEYTAQLDMLPEPLRSQLRYGDFSIGALDDPWQVIPTSWVLEAQNRRSKTVKPDVAMRSAGVDVARGGKDNTVIAPLYGTYFDDLKVHPGSTTPDGPTVARLVTDAVPVSTDIWIDSIGIGASAYDSLRALSGVRVHAVNNSSASRATDKSGRYQFANLRAESYWRFREALDPQSEENICLPLDRRVRVELCAVRFKLVGAKIALESKEDVIKRTGVSPDYADAIVLAWYGAQRSGSLLAFDLFE